MEKAIDSYRIAISMRVAEGFKETGHFLIGSEKDAALKLFSGLAGEQIVSNASLLRMDLIEQADGIDTHWGSLDCSLGQIADNIKAIIKETFRLLNLE